MAWREALLIVVVIAPLVASTALYVAYRQWQGSGPWLVPVPHEGVPMRAVIYTRYGPPDVLALEEVPTPTPTDDEVLIKVRATTVNRTDCGYLRAKPFIIRFRSGFTKPKRPILGNEFAGQVAAVGRSVSSFRVGEWVFGYNEGGAGSHAEYTVVPESGLVMTMPPNVAFEEAAPSTEGAHYALGFIKEAQIRRGHRVLVNGATGAIGSAAVQLLKHFGAEVTAVCGLRNVELVRSLGADAVIDYQREDFTKSDQRYDVVIDAVGKSSFGRCRPLLRPGGIYLSSDLGRLVQNPILALVTPIVGSKRVMFPLPRFGREDLALFHELLAAGKFRGVIDRRYPLENIAEAYRYVEQGHKTGNVVITMD
jgi:NADPH:quinone reductase-like Zn-dependent oxidoreductase